MAIPAEIRGKKYISLTTFRKSGVGVPTPVWFGEENDKLYVMSRNDSGKFKRVRNNPQVKIAPCSIRGKVNGPEFAATARLLPDADFRRAHDTIRGKYWLARLPVWSDKNVFFEITVP